MARPNDFSRLIQSRSPLAAAISLALGAASPAVVHAQEAGDSASPVFAAAAEGQSTERTTRPQNRRRSQTLEEVTVEGEKYRSEVSSPKYTAELVDVPQTVVVIPNASHALFPERPQEVAAALASWIARLPTP